MGSVYRAEDPYIHRTVAVKVLHEPQGLTSQQIRVARERFKREAQAAGSIDHPNVIRIFDVGEDGATGEMYLVMEYVSGPSLEKMLDAGELGLDRGGEIIRQIAAGLDAAHAQGIIHRDVKPSNILLNTDGTAKIVDFGITRIGSSYLTQDMRELGTPAYMSPEQVNGRVLDARADLFALGVVSYEILTGRRPFDGADPVSVAYAIAHAQPPPISVANVELPRALDGLFERILAKEPIERPASGKDFHEAFRACLSEGSAGHSSKPVVISKRRRQALWGLAGFAALALAIALIVSIGKPAAPSAANPSSRAAGTKATPPRPPAAMASLTISLAHRLPRGRLIVSLDGAPIFNEGFSKAKLAMWQTTTWDPLRAPVGAHRLTARVNGDNGKTYLSETYAVEIPRANGIAFRISFSGDKLIVKQTPG
jgi:serine/threonine-protein kinase